MKHANESDMKREVERTLVDVRESLSMHGGDIELLGVDPETGTVTVRLLGTCVGCPMADMTIATIVEETLRERVPGVKKVVNGQA
jgi:Fe-S cluster biogenesis protein NfuA